LRLAGAPNRGLLGADGLRELAALADAAKPDVDATLERHRRVASLALELGDWSVALDRFARLSVEDLSSSAQRAQAAYSAAQSCIRIEAT